MRTAKKLIALILILGIVTLSGAALSEAAAKERRLPYPSLQT